MNEEIIPKEVEKLFLETVENVIINKACTNEQLTIIEDYFSFLIEELQSRNRDDIKFCYMTKLIIYKVKVLSYLFDFDYSETIDINYIEKFNDDINNFYKELKKDKKIFKIIKNLIIEVRYSKDYEIYIRIVNLIRILCDTLATRNIFINNEQNKFTYNDYDDPKMAYVNYRKNLTLTNIQLSSIINKTYY